jgi:hypothetical protein
VSGDETFKGNVVVKEISVNFCFTGMFHLLCFKKWRISAMLAIK